MFKVCECVRLCVCVSVKERMSVSRRALTLGASSLAFFVSRLFAVAASRAGGASPADGTVGRGFNK